MRRPGWLRGGDDPDAEREAEAERSKGPRGEESERAQRERLAKARRERERKARANLAAKARGEGPDATGSSSEPEAGRGGGSQEPRPAKSKPKAEEEAGARKPASARSKPKAEEGGARKPASARSKPKAGTGTRTGAGSPRRRGAPAPKRGAKARGRGAAAGIRPTAARLAASARGRARTIPPRAGAVAATVVVTFFTAFFAALALLLNLLIGAWRFARGPLRAALAALGRGVDAASRALTPARVLALVTAGALVLLALSQFADYRSISIGNDAYAEGIQTVAPPPVTETDVTGSAHSYLMVPLAGVGLLLLGAAMTGRRRLSQAIALVGLTAILVALIHDRPAGLDTGDRSLAYEGVKATLVGGFYAQLAAGLLIIASSLLLGRELGPARAGRPVANARRSAAPRRRGVQGARA